MQPHVNEVVSQKALLRKLRDEVALLRKQLVRHNHHSNSDKFAFQLMKS